VYEAVPCLPKLLIRGPKLLLISKRAMRKGPQERVELVVNGRILPVPSPVVNPIPECRAYTRTGDTLVQYFSNANLQSDAGKRYRRTDVWHKSERVEQKQLGPPSVVFHIVE
jgi:hypothetical protein